MARDREYKLRTAVISGKVIRERIIDLADKLRHRIPNLTLEQIADLGYIKMYAEQIGD